MMTESTTTPFIYNPPADTGLDILFQDESCIILNKPSGLLSVQGRGEAHHDSLAVRVALRFPTAQVVHRLDMSTSGIMLMAFGKKNESTFSKLFQNKHMYKEYVAIVAGCVEPITGETDYPLITDWEKRPRQKVDYELGKSALTQYERISYDETYNESRMKLVPITGRSHQLRVHMATLGHPIMGDKLYAQPEHLTHHSRLKLHACLLAFQHPLTSEHIKIECPAPF